MIMRMDMNEKNAQRLASPAHLGWRLLALLYDTVIAIALLMISSALILYLNHGQPVLAGSLLAYMTLTVFWLVIGAYAVLSWRFGGQTLGMRPWLLKIVNEDGNNAAYRLLCLRYAIASLSFGLAMLWCLFDKDRRGAHDLLSGTWFVRLQPVKAS